ncbi:hypothetical protein L2755_18865 [Shewanella abyssi]|uniref:hypothetical protein n=1 Tax=Shewanella abyssi TaxID=311789 RepID=UPI0020100CA2|nr:hypothetical protein [Shewanella abyssi]MCL1051676.1 hypothetical protein [Shewanella abyssi]
MNISNNINSFFHNSNQVEASASTKHDQQPVVVENGSQALTNALEVVQSAIYHKTEKEQPSSYHPNKNMEVWAVPKETLKERDAREHEIGKLFKRGIRAVSSMRSSFDELLNNVQISNPALADKDWGFTVAEDGGLLVLDPALELTKNETTYLTNLLNSNDELVQLSNKLSESLIDGLALEREPSGSSSYLGKYHVNKSNFKDIIDIRGVIEAPQIHKRVNSFSAAADSFSTFTEVN